jgi:hypothetical protein
MPVDSRCTRDQQQQDGGRYRQLTHPASLRARRCGG